jgi:SRSO17 transposase
VFCAYVTARSQAWADFDVYVPDRWARDLPQRRAAGIPEGMEFATKPQLAMAQLGRAGVRGGYPVRLPGHDAVRRRDPG